MGTDNVLKLRQWHTVDELAEREGVSTRTIYRRLKRGDVEKRETPEGARYRLASESSGSTDTAGVSADSHDTAGDVSRVSGPKENATDTTDSTGVSGVSELTALVSDLIDDVRGLERENTRLRADLENLRESVEPKTNENSGAADTKPEDERALEPAETSEADDTADGCDMTAKEMVDLLRSTANRNASSS